MNKIIAYANNLLTILREKVMKKILDNFFVLVYQHFQFKISLGIHIVLLTTSYILFSIYFLFPTIKGISTSAIGMDSYFEHDIEYDNIFGDIEMWLVFI